MLYTGKYTSDSILQVSTYYYNKYLETTEVAIGWMLLPLMVLMRRGWKHLTIIDSVTCFVQHTLYCIIIISFVMITMSSNHHLDCTCNRILLFVLEFIVNDVKKYILNFYNHENQQLVQSRKRRETWLTYHTTDGIQTWINGKKYMLY